MRSLSRTAATVAVAATTVLGLSACGGGSVEEFCAVYAAIEDADEARAPELLDDLADAAPTDELEEAAETLKEIYEESDGGEEDVPESRQGEFLAALGTIGNYADENCEGGSEE
ncbi:hypothetical protein [Blastococcus sp. SYSU D00820]